MEKGKELDQLVVQSNSMVEAQYKLSLIPQKIIRKLISMVSPVDTEFEKRFYRLSVQDLAHFLGTDIKDNVPGVLYTYVKKAVATLQTTIVSIPKYTDGKKSWLQSTWLASAEYNADGGYYEFEFSQKLEYELLQLKRLFTQYPLGEIAGFSSQYTIRIYELLAQIRNQVIKERIIGLDDLKAILGIKDKYKQYIHFKTKVLEIAKAELLQKAELSQKMELGFEYEPIKTGRKVTAIRLIALLNEKAESPEQPTPAEQAILEKVPPSAKKAAKKAIKKRGVERTQESLAYAEAQIKKGKVKDVGAYVATCLSNGHGAKTQAERTAEQEREARIAELKREADQLQREADAETQRRKDTVARQNALLAALTPDQDAELLRLAEQEILKLTDYQKKRYMVQKKTGETTLIDNQKRKMVEQFLTVQ